MSSSSWIGKWGGGRPSFSKVEFKDKLVSHEMSLKCHRLLHFMDLSVSLKTLLTNSFFNMDEMSFERKFHETLRVLETGLKCFFLSFAFALRAIAERKLEGKKENKFSGGT